jgi:hypothetical protein
MAKLQKVPITFNFGWKAKGVAGMAITLFDPQQKHITKVLRVHEYKTIEEAVKFLKDDEKRDEVEVIQVETEKNKAEIYPSAARFLYDESNHDEWLKATVDELVSKLRPEE